MTIQSPSFENNGMIPKKFSGEGVNINPELRIRDVPAGARSLALIMHDPDAPRPGGFTHWVMWNIAPMTTVINEGSVPPGAREGKNGRGTSYLGPYPPPGHGIHHYEFHLYALDTPLDLPATAGKAELETEVRKHLIEEAELVGLYERPE